MVYIINLFIFVPNLIIKHKNMDAKLTEQESLEIISKMIEQARNNLQKGSGNNMIFIGLLVAFTAILNVILALIFMQKGTNPNLACWVWCLMIPGSYINYLIDNKSTRKQMVKTHIDSIIHSTWKGYMYSTVVLLAVFFGIGLGQKFYHVFYLINPIVLVFVGLSEFITAKACRFKPYMYGAFIMWLGALACVAAMWFKESAIIQPVFIQFFILALCMITGFVIPGYQLNKLAKENV